MSRIAEFEQDCIQAVRSSPLSLTVAFSLWLKLWLKVGANFSPILRSARDAPRLGTIQVFEMSDSEH